jgi:type I restriction enzyme S subunit
MALPPLDEQRRIAEVLRSVDEAVAATDAAVGAIRAVRQSTLDALVLDVLKSSHGITRDLSEAAEIRTGLAKNKNASGRHVRLPYLRVANVQDGWFDLSDMQKIDVAPDQVQRYALKSGDVLLTEGGDYDKLGRGGVWRAQIEPCLHQNHIFCVRPEPAILLSDFLALLTQSYLGRSYFLSCAKRTTNLASINSSQLKLFPLPVASIKLQQRIIDEIGSIDAVTEREEEKQRKLTSLRSGLLDELLSGRVRVPA